MFDLKIHRQILFEMITNIYRSSCGAYLGFKGGTMAYFFYGLTRFSIDLDFDLIDEEKKEFVFKTLPKLIVKFGSIKEAYEKRYTLFYLLNYQKGAKNIKLEISKRKNEFITYRSANFYGTDVKIMVESDAFTTKLLAATTRNRIAYRDFYDIYFYLQKGVEINNKLIKAITGKDTKAYLKYLSKFIEKNITSRTILHGLGELVDEKQKVWIKNNLKQELINRLSFILKDPL